jgi:hypothetical protein
MVVNAGDSRRPRFILGLDKLLFVWYTYIVKIRYKEFEVYAVI